MISIRFLIECLLDFQQNFYYMFNRISANRGFKPAPEFRPIVSYIKSSLTPEVDTDTINQPHFDNEDFLSINISREKI